MRPINQGFAPGAASGFRRPVIGWTGIESTLDGIEGPKCSGWVNVLELRESFLYLLVPRFGQKASGQLLRVHAFETEIVRQGKSAGLRRRMNGPAAQTCQRGPACSSAKKFTSDVRVLFSRIAQANRRFHDAGKKRAKFRWDVPASTDFPHEIRSQWRAISPAQARPRGCFRPPFRGSGTNFRDESFW